jgi:arginine repressor
MITFELEHYETQEEVREHIQNCGGKHIQQATINKCIDCKKEIDKRSKRWF